MNFNYLQLNIDKTGVIFLVKPKKKPLWEHSINFKGIKIWWGLERCIRAPYKYQAVKNSFFQQLKYFMFKCRRRPKRYVRGRSHRNNLCATHMVDRQTPVSHLATDDFNRGHKNQLQNLLSNATVQFPCTTSLTKRAKNTYCFEVSTIMNPEDLVG